MLRMFCLPVPSSGTSFAGEILSEFLFILQNSVQSYYQLLQKASRPHMLPNLFRNPFRPPSPMTARYRTNHVTALWKSSVWGATKWSHTLFNFTSDLIGWKYLIVRREYFKTDFLNRFIFRSFVHVSVYMGIWVSVDTRKGHWIPRKWSFWWLPMVIHDARNWTRVLSFARVANTLNHWPYLWSPMNWHFVVI